MVITIYFLWLEETFLASNSLTFNVIAFITEHKWNFYVHLEHYTILNRNTIFSLRGGILISRGDGER